MRVSKTTEDDPSDVESDNARSQRSMAGARSREHQRSFTSKTIHQLPYFRYKSSYYIYSACFNYSNILRFYYAFSSIWWSVNHNADIERDEKNCWKQSRKNNCYGKNACWHEISGFNWSFWNVTTNDSAEKNKISKLSSFLIRWLTHECSRPEQINSSTQLRS